MSATHEWWEDFFHGPWGELQARGFAAEKTSAEVDFLVDVLGLAKGSAVLDLACGVGRHTNELAARGVEVTGLDFNEKAIEQAREAAAAAGVAPRFVVEDMRRLDARDAFDAVYCFWTSFGYFENERDDLVVAQRVAAALKPGGRFLVDLHVTESIFPKLRARRWEWLDESHECILLEEATWNPATSRVDAEWIFVGNDTVRRSRSSVRAYSYRELCDLLREAGFRRFEGCETGSGKPFVLGSPRLSLIATL